jgi:hypothetical protein
MVSFDLVHTGKNNGMPENMSVSLVIPATQRHTLFLQRVIQMIPGDPSLANHICIRL